MREEAPRLFVSVTRRIRARDDGRAVKIAALTASVFEDERDRVLAAGMDDFVRKPYRPEEVFACLQRHLGVELRTEERVVSRHEDSAGALDPQAVEELPSDLRAELTDAVVALDTVRIDRLIVRVREHSPELGAALRHRADHLELTAVLRALRAGSDGQVEALS